MNIMEMKAAPLSQHEITIETAVGARDLEGINRLWRDVYGTNFDSKYDWAYRSDPDGASLFVAKMPDGSVIGMVGVVRRRFSVNWRMTEAWQLVDFATAPSHRNLLTALSLQKHAIRIHPGCGISLLYGFPNEKSVRVQLRAGFKELGMMGRWVKPLNLKAHLEKKHVPQAGMIAPIGNAVFRISDYFRFSITEGYACKKLDSFDRSFNALWESASTRFLGIGIRDAEYLNWRFIANPDVSYDIFALMRADSLPAGYIVYAVREGVCHITDMLAKSEKAMFLMLMKFSQMMRRESISMISFQFGGDDKVGSVLTRAGFILRERGMRVLIYAGSIPYENRITERMSLWYLTDADRDV
jgi:hypothetical protein